jgi:hypothetical protein
MQLYRLIILVSLFAFTSVQAGVVFIEVESVGHGTTVHEAVNHALAEAIGRVQGKSIDSSTQLITTEESVDTTDDPSHYASEKYISTVRDQTKK